MVLRGVPTAWFPGDDFERDQVTAGCVFGFTSADSPNRRRPCFFDRKFQMCNALSEGFATLCSDHEVDRVLIGESSGDNT